MKPIEQHLAIYLLSLVRGPWTKDYNRRCVALWKEKYGEQVAAKVERLVKDKWHESPSSYATTQDLAYRFTKTDMRKPRCCSAARCNLPPEHYSGPPRNCRSWRKCP